MDTLLRDERIRPPSHWCAKSSQARPRGPSKLRRRNEAQALPRCAIISTRWSSSTSSGVIGRLNVAAMLKLSHCQTALFG
ncbi:unnamed protein product [Phyllotreta striolata]|uniref:Uncharacterized protein n=1 Tax=Phyllotreta striolata TaxID=444603 RepID=A0A9N9XT57_PHYSR|nr:unnamed protein product [Phyllotreta striolata]